VADASVALRTRYWTSHSLCGKSTPFDCADLIDLRHVFTAVGGGLNRPNGSLYCPAKMSRNYFVFFQQFPTFVWISSDFRLCERQVGFRKMRQGRDTRPACPPYVSRLTQPMGRAFDFPIASHCRTSPPDAGAASRVRLRRSAHPYQCKFVGSTRTRASPGVDC
jgi:hypothetical protein